MRALLLATLLVAGCGKNGDRAKPQATASTWPEAKLVAMGSVHACAVASTGEVRCFGRSNIFGQAGIDVKVETAQAQAAKGLDDHPVRLAAGAQGTCALYGDGHIKCIGTSRLVPGRKGTEDPNDPYVDLAVNSQDLCALRKSGKLLCFNADTDFEAIEGLPPIESVSLGYRLGCAVTRDHDAYCFAWPRQGKLKVEKVTSNAAAVYTTGAVTCVVSPDRKLSCRGTNDRGVLGAEKKSDTFLPIADDVEGFSLSDHACFLRAGAPYCWGWNEYGQVGDGTRDNKTAPTKVETTESFVSIAAGDMRTCGRTTKGTLVCWGLQNTDDMRGNSPIDRFRPTTISDL